MKSDMKRIFLIFEGFELDDTSQCVPEGKCRYITCSRQHAKCVNLGPDEKGYDLLGKKDQAIGYSCVEKCHEVGFDNFN